MFTKVSVPSQTNAVHTLTPDYCPPTYVYNPSRSPFTFSDQNAVLTVVMPLLEMIIIIIYSEKNRQDILRNTAVA
jgi:hypothetical protein